MEKSLKRIIKNSSQISLYTLLSGRRYDNKKGWVKMRQNKDLMSYVADLVTDTIGGGRDTKESIKDNILFYPSYLLKNSWMTERIIFSISRHDGSVRCQYVAGKDYGAEIRRVRKHLKS